MENNKMKNLASTLETIVKVVGSIFFAVSIVCGVMAVLVAIFGEKMFAEGELSLSLGFVKFYATDALEVKTGFMNAYVIVGLVTVMIICVAVYLASKLTRSVLEPIKDGRPFEAQVPKKLKKLAWVVLGCGALIQVAGIVESVLLSYAYSLNEIVNPLYISKVEFDYSVDFSFVLVFAIIMFLSYIFSYGQKLQQESDETL